MLCLLPKISRLPVSRSKPHRICTDTGSFGSSPVEESAKDAIQAYARPASIGVTGVSGGRHLGPTYDEAIQDYAMSAAKDNKDAAVAWAERITDPKLRADTIRRVAPQVQVKTIFLEAN